jgi:uncharacterized protein (TIGR00369 family)
MNDTQLTLETANNRLNEIFAPFIQALNLQIEQLDHDKVVMRMPFDENIVRAGGIICGQALMALIDTCMVFVAYAGMRRFAEVTTVSQETRFMRPAIGKDVIATGTVTKAGKTLLFGQVTLSMDGDERPICDGTSIYAILN